VGSSPPLAVFPGASALPSKDRPECLWAVRWVRQSVAHRVLLALHLSPGIGFGGRSPLPGACPGASVPLLKGKPEFPRVDLWVRLPVAHRAPPVLRRSPAIGCVDRSLLPGVCLEESALPSKGRLGCPRVDPWARPPVAHRALLVLHRFLATCCVDNLPPPEASRGVDVLPLMGNSGPRLLVQPLVAHRARLLDCPPGSKSRPPTLHWGGRFMARRVWAGLRPVRLRVGPVPLLVARPEVGAEVEARSVTGGKSEARVRLVGEERPAASAGYSNRQSTWPNGRPPLVLRWSCGTWGPTPVISRTPLRGTGFRAVSIQTRLTARGL